MKRMAILAAGMMAAMASPAFATTVFSEDFSGATPGTYGTGAIGGTGFTVSGANVDIVGVLNGSFFNCVGNPGGNCVDLVGNSGAGSLLTSTPIALTAGATYTISFSDVLQGFNAGDPATSDFTVGLGGASFSLISLGGVVTSRSLSFVAAATDPSAALTFSTTTAPDSVHGPVVQNIAVGETLAAVPEPASWALMIGGFGLVGGSLRRRRTLVALA